ncbi:MAG: response regulator transcription factor [Deltaproteobacteria bacterium]|nr:response regulator transcription factor [Deltaproteobacteria bacterium]
MGRPRVILASQDPRAAVRLRAAFDPRRYRVEHAFDATEALLRAEVVLAHAVVLQADALDQALRQRCAKRSRRVALVLVSESERVATVAAKLGAGFVRQPFEPAQLCSCVQALIARAARHRQPPAPGAPEARRDGGARILLLLADSVPRSVMAAVLEKELDVACESAGDVDLAIQALAAPVACLIADPQALLDHDRGVDLTERLSQRGVSLVPIAPEHYADAAAAGQAAWDIIPRLREILDELRPEEDLSSTPAPDSEHPRSGRKKA